MDQYNAFKDTLNTFYRDNVNEDVTDAFNDIGGGSIIKLLDMLTTIGIDHPVIRDANMIVDFVDRFMYVDWSAIELESIKESKDVVHVN